MEEYFTTSLNFAKVWALDVPPQWAQLETTVKPGCLDGLNSRLDREDKLAH